jgi:secreted Zn-dependent insulinase-like peptidase
LNQTFRLAASELGTVITAEAAEQRDKRAEIEKMTYADFQALHTDWFTSSYQVWHIEGNISKDSAVSTVETSIKVLAHKPVAKANIASIRSTNIPSSIKQRLNFEVEDPANDNSCLLTFFQCGP